MIDARPSPHPPPEKKKRPPQENYFSKKRESRCSSPQRGKGGGGSSTSHEGEELAGKGGGPVALTHGEEGRGESGISSVRWGSVGMEKAHIPRRVRRGKKKRRKERLCISVVVGREKAVRSRGIRGGQGGLKRA